MSITNFCAMWEQEVKIKVKKKKKEQQNVAFFVLNQHISMMKQSSSAVDK